MQAEVVNIFLLGSSADRNFAETITQLQDRAGSTLALMFAYHTQVLSLKVYLWLLDPSNLYL